MRVCSSVEASTRFSNLGVKAVFGAVAAPLLVFYLLVPNPGTHPSGDHIDPLTNAVTGWHLGIRGTVILEGYEQATRPEYYRNIGWYVDSPRGPVSHYPPGAAAIAAPFYRVAGDPLTPKQMIGTNNPDAPPLELPMPSVGPATLAAQIAVAAAMALLAASLAVAGLSPVAAVATGLLAGVATPMWTVAASALWQHGPAALWLAMGVLLVAKSKYFASGLAFGAAVMTRPHLALIAAAVGIYVAWKEHRLRPMVGIGLGSAVGLAGILAYNWWLWGRLTISGGYGRDFTDNLTSGDSVGYVENLFWALFDPAVGIIMVSIFLVPLLLRIRPAWRDAPPWAQGAAIGGILYLLVQYKANRFSGGAGFLGYRYPLEALTAITPLLAFAYPHWVGARPSARTMFWVTVAASLLLLLAR